MPSNNVPGFLVDQFGRQVFWGGGSVLHQRDPDDDRLRPLPANHFADYIALLSPSRLRELMSECRSIASRGVTSALIDSKAAYVSSSKFAPEFIGTDSDYGDEVIEALHEALQICSIPGPRYDWCATWALGPRIRATDGSYFVLLTEWGDTGWPAIQILEGHRIWQRDITNGIVGPDDALTIIIAEDGSKREVRGAYQGLRINKGIIYNEVGTEVAYRVLGENKDWDEDISARDMIHVARPTRFSEGRPAPEMASAIMDFAAIDLAQTCQLDQQIIDARLTLIETNATGKYDAGAQFRTLQPPTGTPVGTPTEVDERGMTRFIKSGMSLTPHESARPSDQWMNFDWRVLQRAAASFRWRAEMLDPSKLGGAANRSFQDQINTEIQHEFLIDARAATRVLRYFNAKLTALGRVRKHPEWQRLTVAKPTYFEVDRASAKIDIDDVASGRQAMPILHSRDGYTTPQIYKMRINAHKLALKMQAQEKAKGVDIPLTIIQGDLGYTAQREGFFPTADPSPDPAAPQPEPTPPKTPKPDKP